VALLLGPDFDSRLFRHPTRLDDVQLAPSAGAFMLI